MNKSFWITALSILVTGIGIAAPFTTGFGKGPITITNSVAVQSYTGLDLNTVTIYNTSAVGSIYVLVNVTPVGYTNAVTLTNAITVLPASNFTFDYQGRGIIHELCFGAVGAAGTNVVYFAGY